MAVVYARGSEFLSRGKGFDADRILSQGQDFDADRGRVEFDADRIFAGTGFRCGQNFAVGAGFRCGQDFVTGTGFRCG